jgi:hypothetical protein
VNAPIRGVWEVTSDSSDFTPDMVDIIKERLIAAAEAGEENVIVRNIELRWRPIEVLDPEIDVDAFADAIAAAMARVPWPGEGGSLKFGGLTYKSAARAIANEFVRGLNDD